jgi:hypothetical protein
MKKAFSLVMFVLMVGVFVSAQDYKTSLGIRAGVPFGPSGGTIRHFLNRTNAVEGILASNFGTGITLTGLFENEHWTGYYPGINWYWGLGAHIGFMDASATRWVPASYSGGSIMGFDGVFGVEYTFDKIPLNISVDVMPSFNLWGYTGVNFFNSGISARYVF